MLASELKKIAIKVKNEEVIGRESFILWVKEEASSWAKEGKLQFEINIADLGAWELLEIRSSFMSLKNDGFKCNLELNCLKVSWE